MTAHSFPSPEAQIATIQNANLRIALQRKIGQPWTMTRLDLQGLRVQWDQVEDGTLTEGAISPSGPLRSRLSTALRRTPVRDVAPLSAVHRSRSAVKPIGLPLATG